MRHNVAGKKLGRDMAHRKALLRNLTTSIIEHGSVTTTISKAKYAKPFIEKAITKAKKGKVRELRKIITTEDMIRKAVEEVASKFEGRDGGYLRLIKLGRRDGDNADMARLELITEEKKEKATAKKAKIEKKEEEVEDVVEETIDEVVEEAEESEESETIEEEVIEKTEEAEEEVTEEKEND